LKDSLLVYIGVDLGSSAVSKKPSSAMAILNDSGQLIEKPQHFRKASELVKDVSKYSPESIILAVDAPRSVPNNTEENYAYRSCEQAIKAIDTKAGSFYGAAALYIRWYEIENKYFQNIKVIETYPRIVWKILGFPSTPRYLSQNKEIVYSKLSNLIGSSFQPSSPHQVDAILCAYTAYCYGKNDYSWFGNPGEGLIITPPAGIDNTTISKNSELIKEQFKCFISMA